MRMEIQKIKERVINLYVLLLVVLPISGLLFLTIITKYFQTITASTVVRGSLLLFLYVGLVYIIKSIKSDDRDHFSQIIAPNIIKYSKTSIIVFIIVYLASIIYLNIIIDKDIIYPILLTILYLLVFLQIIGAQIGSGIILGEIVLTFCNSVLSVLLRHPFYFGQSDTFYHVAYASIVFNSGRTMPSDFITTIYTNYPIQQILTNVGSNLLNVSLLTSLNIMSGLIFSISIIIIYCIFKLFVPDRIALLACLLYSTTSVVITVAICTMPYALAFIFFLLILFIFLKIDISIDHRNIFACLLVPIITVLVYTHHASMSHIAILLILIYSAIVSLNYLTREKRKTVFFPFILFLLAFLFHWFYIDPQTSIYFQTLSINFFSSANIMEIFAQPSVKSSATVDVLSSNLVFFINNIPHIILIFSVLIGVAFIIKNRSDKQSWIFAVLALIGLPFWIPIILNNLDLFAFFPFFTLNRLSIFFGPFIMLIFAFGFLGTLSHFNKLNMKIIPIALVSLFVIYSFTLLINTENYDYRMEIDRGFYTSYFNEEDLDAINFVNNQTDNGAMITSDFFPYKYMSSLLLIPQIETGSESLKSLKMFNSIGSNSNTKGYSLFRIGEYKKAGLLIYPIISYDEHEMFEREFIKSDMIFTSGNNVIFFQK